MKKSSFPKALLLIILSTVITTLAGDLIEKRHILTTKNNLETHLTEYKADNKIDIALKKKIGNQYFLLYSIDGQSDKIGLAQYRKTDVYPLYELVRDEETDRGMLGSSFLNHNRFLVYGNRKQTGAAYFQYRDHIAFKKIGIEGESYFIQAERYEGQLAVPLVTFYNKEGEAVADTPAR
jgi:hypothetical protein